MAQQQSVFEIPASVTGLAEQMVAARRGWSGPIGMTMTQGQPEGGDGGGNDEGSGLLDDEAENGGDGNDGDGDGGDGGQNGGGNSGGSGGAQGFDPAAFEQRMTDTIQRRLDSAINTISRRLTGQQGGQGGGNGGQDGNGGGNDDGGNSGGGQQQAGPNASDSREARMVYREFVGGEIKFLGNEERDFAQTLATGLLRERLERGDDPEAAGRAVASEVAKQMKSLRGHYEKKVLSALRRQGKIPADGRGPGQPLQGGSAPGDASGFQKGQSRAQTMFAGRMPQQQS